MGSGRTVEREVVTDCAAIGRIGGFFRKGQFRLYVMETIVFDDIGYHNAECGGAKGTPIQ